MKQRLFFRLAATVACVTPSYLAAQDHDAQLWPALNANLDLGGNATLQTQAVARFGDDAGGLYELEFQGDLDVAAGDGVRVGGGYVYLPAFNRGDVTSTEQRVRQHVTVRVGEVLGGRVEARLRLEQRWRDDGDDVAFRLRPYIVWTRPIGPDGLVLRLWHESFINLNDTDWGGQARYARSRNQVSLRRKLGAAVTGELGYVSQYDLSSTGPDRLIHALAAAVTFDF